MPESATAELKTNAPCSKNAWLSASYTRQLWQLHRMGNKRRTPALQKNLFKTRFANHKATLNSRLKRTATELSNYILDLKDKAVEYHTTWRIVKQAPSFTSSYHRCNLCSWERYYIIFQPEMASLNKRRELRAACRPERKYTLAHCKV